MVCLNGESVALRSSVKDVGFLCHIRKDVVGLAVLARILSPGDGEMPLLWQAGEIGLAVIADNKFAVLILRCYRRASG